MATVVMVLLVLGIQWNQAEESRASTGREVVPQSWENSQFGFQVIGVSNLAGSGKPGVLVGAPGGAGKRPGFVRAYSAADGGLLWSASGGGFEAGLGWRLSALGDIDGDGIGDAAACCPKDDSDAELWILSGRSGKAIRVLKGTWRYFGMYACGLPDTNKDGTPDIAIWGRVPVAPAGELRNGVLVYSGKDGTILRELKGEESGGCPLPDSMVSTGDVDGGGLADLALATESTVVILSTESGAQLRRIQVDSKPEDLRLLANTGDVGKGAGNLFVSCAAGAARILRITLQSGKQGTFVESEEGASEGRPRAMAWIRRKEKGGLLAAGFPDCPVGGEPSAGKVAVFDGTDGKPTYAVESPSGSGHFGRSLATLDDVDGDGVDELVVGAPLFSPGPKEADGARGRVYLLSGRTGSVLLALGPEGREEIEKKTGGK